MAQIVWRGESYEVIDPLNWFRPEASFIRKTTGQTVAEIAANAMQSDPDAIAALIYVAKKRRGDKVRWSDFDELAMSDIDFVLDDDESADEESESDDAEGDGVGDGVDPTSPTGPTRTRGSTTTSTRSRSTSTSTRAKSTS